MLTNKKESTLSNDDLPKGFTIPMVNPIENCDSEEGVNQ